MNNPILREEAEAFGRHAQERYKHGHLPDLRRVTPCDWFFNNPWRRPYLINRECGRNLRFALQHFKPKSRLLEVGSGPGHMALEFAREGFGVTGLELAAGAVDIARQIAKENPCTGNFGSLEYVVDDFFAWEPLHKYDSACMFGTLHHFVDPGEVLDRLDTMLTDDAVVVIVEPSRDRHSIHDAAIVSMIRNILSVGGHYFQEIPAPASLEEFEARAAETLREYQDATDSAEIEQSPNDNSAFSGDMLAALRSRYDEIEFQWGDSFMFRLGGGIRGDEREERALAQTLDVFDRYAVKSGLMNGGEFLFAGRRKKY